jgi:hypothetical protein
MKKQAVAFLEQPTLTGRKIAQFVGITLAMTLMISPALFFYRGLQSVKNATLVMRQGLDSRVCLGADQKAELAWWKDQAHLWNGRSLRPPEKILKIQTDASNSGWGAVCQTNRTGGLWTPVERTQHINYLELLAAFLAIRTFAKNETRITIHVQMDNMSAMTYINRRGGTHSASLTNLAKECWTWCMDREITLCAEHIPGVRNVIADKESRAQGDRWDWKLNPEIFNKIQQIWGPFQADLFASRNSFQIPRFFSWRPDPLAEATDAFQQMWPNPSFANPPWMLIPRVLSEIRTQQSRLVLIAPVWKAQSWYPVLLTALIDHPRLIPAAESTVVQIHNIPLPFRGHEVQLAAWPLSGIPTEQEAYRRRQQTSSWPHGVQNPNPATTHSFRSGSAGVYNGIEIPFMDL